jgi:CRISPR-associated protein Csx10
VNRIPVRISVEIALDTPFHVGGGKGGAGTCSYLVRDGNGVPYWPGSAFKGKVRHFARLLLEGALDEQCNFEHSLQDGDDVSHCGCLVCDMLGGAGNARGSLLFGDMKLQTASTEMRTGNAIDRYRRTARDNSLFQIETAVGDMLKGEITGTLSESRFDEQKELLKAAIEAVPHIGGNTGRGLGWVAKHGITVTIEKVESEEPSAQENVPSEITVPVRITAQSPLLIGTKTSESNFRATLPYIPGGVVRAALSQALIAQDGGAEEGKVNWVAPEGGQGQFPSLRKAFSELRITQFLPGCRFRFGGCRFAPMTAEHPKRSRQSSDTLLNRHREDVPMERVKGFINACGESAEPIQTMVVTKSAMNRFSGTSQDEMLFSMEVMVPPVVFEGTISGAFDPAEFARLTKKGIRVGGYQTAGYGQCKVEVLQQSDAADTSEGLRERIEKCGGKIPVTLHSDAIVNLELPGDSSNDGYLQAYQEALFPALPGVKLLKAIAQHGQWRGFDTSKRTGFLNEPTHVIKAGAVFLLEAQELTRELVAALLALQAQGICQDNKYNRNGYGQVRIADEYHFLREDK